MSIGKEVLMVLNFGDVVLLKKFLMRHSEQSLDFLERGGADFLEEGVLIESGSVVSCFRVC